MCEVMEKYNKEAVKENNFKSIEEMLRDNVPKENIKRYLRVTDKDIEEVEAFLLQMR